MTVRQIQPDLFLVDLDFQETPDALVTYVIRGADSAAIVDTGPTSVQPALLRGLAAVGVDRAAVSDVLLTHIHLDHSGGAGALAALLPNARFYVHPVGAKHLLDPSRLIRSATTVYGDELMARLWGPIVPVPAERLTVVADGERVWAAGRELVALDTPGHASHHHTYWEPDARWAFTGDIAGTRLPDFDTPLPAAVPPEWDLELCEASLDRIAGLAPALLLLPHGTEVRDVDRHLGIVRRHLRDWETFIRAELAAGTEESRLVERLRARYQRWPNGEPLGESMCHRMEVQSPAAFAVAAYRRYFERQRRRGDAEMRR